jgi:hypothetical protein
MGGLAIGPVGRLSAGIIAEPLPPTTGFRVQSSAATFTGMSVACTTDRLDRDHLAGVGS